VIAVPLIALGVTWVLATLTGRNLLSQPVAAAHGAWRAVLAALGAVALLGSLTIMALRPGRQAEYAYGWSTPAKPRMLTPDELAMIRRLGGEIGPGLILGDPLSGSAYSYALTGHRVALPHVTGVWGADRRYLIDHLPAIGTDPKVCQALERLDVRYLYLDQDRFRGLTNYASLTKDLKLDRGFELVDQGGGAALYRITACGPGAGN
jgi:hypothetical protein